MNGKPTLPLLGLCLAAWLGTSCAGYRLGPVNPAMAAGRSVFVQPVLNQTMEPRLAEALTSALRRQFQREGTFQLARAGEADIVLTSTVLELHRIGVSFHPQDVVRPQDFQVTLRAHVRAVQRGSGHMLLDRSFEGRALMRIGPDLTSAERQVLPLLADDLARQVVLALAEGEW